MRLHEFVVGVEREVGPALIVNARYIRKRVDRALEDVGTRSSPGGDYEVWVATPGQGKVAWFYPEGTSTPVALPKARRNYDAVEASVDRRAVEGGRPVRRTRGAA